MTDMVVVLVTCGSAGEAQRIARALVERRLAACVNTLPAPVRSIYRWKGKIETAREFVLVIKSSRQKFPAVSRMIRAAHSYDIPEVIALPIVAGAAAYRRWLEESLRRLGARRRKRAAR